MLYDGKAPAWLSQQRRYGCQQVVDLWQPSLGFIYFVPMRRSCLRLETECLVGENQDLGKVEHLWKRVS